eukprot:TRINITY_DN1745_c0_g1_i5.p1 TRINITY_DN1745_c0_g1~~TRINITY_DN1745_c0_g1_i5.p1  ORF type:complete len:360 (-),score=74.55 TRINITY_DN1745_c0_g1_i5:432-1511(-)
MSSGGTWIRRLQGLLRQADEKSQQEAAQPGGGGGQRKARVAVGTLREGEDGAGPPGSAGAAVTRAVPPEPQQHASIVRPDVSKMAVYDPRQGLGGPVTGMALMAAASGPPQVLRSQQNQNQSQIQAQLAGQVQLGTGVVNNMGGGYAGGGAVGAPGGQQQQQQYAVVASPATPPPLLVHSGSLALSLPPGVVVPSIQQQHLQQQQLQPVGAEDWRRGLHPRIAAFLQTLPAVPGPYPDVDLVLSLLLKADLPLPGTLPHLQDGVTSANVPGSLAALSAHGSSAPDQAPLPSSKRKDPERGVGADPGGPPPRDLYRWRLLQKSRAGGGPGGAPSSGTASGGGATQDSDRVSNSLGSQGIQ